jgi:aminoglycoside 6'-N-acetyltransferase I
MRETPHLVVRAATPDDAPALAELIAEFNGPQGDARNTAARLAACAGLETALLAFVASEPVGFSCLRLTPAIGTRYPHALLTELYVREPFRRSGVGKALLEHAERLAQAQGAYALYLWTGHENYGAQAFYERQGYAVEGVTYRKPFGPKPSWPS